MGREATINVSLTPQQLRLVRQRVRSGGYASASEVIREGLRVLFKHDQAHDTKPAGSLKDRLAAGYKACARQDRAIAREWAQLGEAWPNE
jgi:antitoxin ParD1/3/4